MWTTVTGPIEACNNQVSTIENYELAKVIAEGIRSYYIELINKERDDNAKLAEDTIKSNSILRELKELQSAYRSYERDKKNLKWYQSKERWDYKMKSILQNAIDIVGIENLTYYKGYYDSICELVSEVKNKIRNAVYIRDEYPSTPTILAIISLIPDFKNKSFKELIEIVNQQTSK